MPGTKAAKEAVGKMEKIRMMTPKGWKIMDKPRPGEDLKHFIRRLRKKDHLCLQDDAVMRSKGMAGWKVNQGNDNPIDDAD